MPVQSAVQSFRFGDALIEIFVPENPERLVHSHSPYWAKIWPAAIGLCRFLENNLQYISDKKILELAAGLGLPGLFAARYATEVCLSDVEPQAVALMQQSVIHNRFTNVQCGVIDWNSINDTAIPDVLLLSDINYEPSSFSVLLSVIHKFLDAGAAIILSTPQRLMAKEFVSQLLPFSIRQAEIIAGTDTAVSVFVLLKKETPPV